MPLIEVLAPSCLPHPHPGHVHRYPKQIWGRPQFLGTPACCRIRDSYTLLTNSPTGNAGRLCKRDRFRLFIVESPQCIFLGRLPYIFCNVSSTHPLFVSADIVDDLGSPTIDAVFEVPGLRSDEIHVTLREGHLVVHGERRPSYRNPTSDPVEASSSQSSHDTRAPVVRELRYGPFQRRIKLPDNTKVGFLHLPVCKPLLSGIELGIRYCCQTRRRDAEGYVA